MEGKEKEKEKSDLDLLVEGLQTNKIPIGVLTGRPRKWIYRRGKERKIIAVYPQFYHCLKPRCDYILECWDLNEEKFMGKLDKKGFPIFPDFCEFKKRQKEIWQRRIKREKKTIKNFLSDFDASLLYLALKYFITQKALRQTQYIELLKNVQDCERVVLYIPTK